MNIQIIDINKLIPATYNPRKDLKPDDAEYIKIKNSIVKFGFVSPLVINKDMTVIGGHQRLKVLKDLGITTYKEIFINYPDMFLMDASNFEESFSKYDKEELV